MKRLFLTLACLSAFLFATAQENIIESLEQKVPGQGKVTVHQDARIEALIGKARPASVAEGQQVLKAAGYRVQVYAGSNTRIEEADAMMRRLRSSGQFKEVSIVRDQINIPL